jgi:dUTP pyrophosphatase
MDLQELLKKLNEGLNASEETSINDALKDSGIDLEMLNAEMQNYTPKIELGYVILNEDTKPPQYNYETDSGFDLCSVESLVLKPFERALVPTGLAFDIPEGYEIQVRSKSGLAINQGLFVLNSPGTVDSGYNAEIKVIVMNVGQDTITITKGMKVAQAVLCPVVAGKWVDLDRRNEMGKKDRGANGFGSTGIFS